MRIEYKHQYICENCNKIRSSNVRHKICKECEEKYVKISRKDYDEIIKEIVKEKIKKSLKKYPSVSDRKYYNKMNKTIQIPKKR